MKKVIFWVTLLLGLFFLIGTLVTVLSHTIKIADQITIAAIPYVLVGMLLDFITNPAGWLGIVFLVGAFLVKRKLAIKKPVID